jgi:hypothetical protein
MVLCGAGEQCDQDHLQPPRPRGGRRGWAVGSGQWAVALGTGHGDPDAHPLSRPAWWAREGVRVRCEMPSRDEAYVCAARDCSMLAERGMLSAAPEEESRRLGRQYETPQRSMASAVGFLLPASPSPLLPPQNLLSVSSRAPCRITRRLRVACGPLAARPGRDEPRRPMSPPADAGMLPCPRSLANSSGCPQRLGGPATAETARSRRSAVPEAPIRRRRQAQYVPLGRASRARRMAPADWASALRSRRTVLSTVHTLYVGPRRQTTPPKPPSATTGQGGGVSATGVAPPP